LSWERGKFGDVPILVVVAGGIEVVWRTGKNPAIRIY
jgi:hypothetical protein